MNLLAAILSMALRREVADAVGAFAFIATIVLAHAALAAGALAVLLVVATATPRLVARAAEQADLRPYRSLLVGVAVALVWIGLAKVAQRAHSGPLGLALVVAGGLALVYGAAASACALGSRLLTRSGSDDLAARALPRHAGPLALGLGWAVLAGLALAPFVGWALLGGALLVGVGAVAHGAFVREGL